MSRPGPDPQGPESGLDRMDSTLFVLAFLSRIEDRRRRRRFAPSLTRMPTRTTSIHAIKAATSISLNCIDRTWVDDLRCPLISVKPTGSYRLQHPRLPPRQAGAGQFRRRKI